MVINLGYKKKNKLSLVDTYLPSTLDTYVCERDRIIHYRNIVAILHHFTK